MKYAILSAAVLSVVLANIASAHHSFAMFDQQKETTLTGALKELQWANPHIWVQVLVKDPATGQDVEWSVEGGSPDNLSRKGWSRHSMKAGDKVVIDDLFRNDVLILDRFRSRSLRYGADSGPQLEIGFPDSTWLGLWTRPGAPFICIEPWQGVTDPAGFNGDLRDKPGVFEVAPGTAHSLTMTVTLVGPESR